MTSEQIEELNLAVATKVMGWKMPEGFNANMVDDWSPMTNIQDAWEVVEKIKGEFFIVSYVDNKHTATRGWEVNNTYSEYISGCVAYPTITEAICRYALSLVEGKWLS